MKGVGYYRLHEQQDPSLAKRECTLLQLAEVYYVSPSLESYELENNPPDMQKPRFFKRG